jgi:hypothetical protein
MLIKKSGFEVIAKIDTLSKKSLKHGSFAILVFFRVDLWQHFILLQVEYPVQKI